MIFGDGYHSYHTFSANASKKTLHVGECHQTPDFGEFPTPEQPTTPYTAVPRSTNGWPALSGFCIPPSLSAFASARQPSAVTALNRAGDQLFDQPCLRPDPITSSLGLERRSGEKSFHFQKFGPRAFYVHSCVCNDHTMGSHFITRQSVARSLLRPIFRMCITRSGFPQQSCCRAAERICQLQLFGCYV